MVRVHQYLRRRTLQSAADDYKKETVPELKRLVDRSNAAAVEEFGRRPIMCCN